MDILNLFGIDWRLMLAQIFNFSIVVGILWWYAFKPLTKKMDERGKEIEKGVKDAKLASERLDEVEKQVKNRIKESRFDAEVILNEAKQQIDKNRKEELEKTKVKIDEMLVKAKKQIENEKDLMMGEAREEIAEIINKALIKILSESLSKDLDKKYIDQVLKKIEHEN